MKYHRNQHMNYSVMATAVMCEVTVTFDHQNLIRSLSSRWRFSHFWRTIPWRRAGDIELTDWSIQPLSSITLLPLLVSSLMSFSETRTFPWRRTPDLLATSSCCIKFRTSQLFLLFFLCWRPSKAAWRTSPLLEDSEPGYKQIISLYQEFSSVLWVARFEEPSWVHIFPNNLNQSTPAFCQTLCSCQALCKCISTKTSCC